MTSRRNRLIESYLQRFDNASVFLAADRREELRQEIVEHIDAGLEEADARHAEAVRVVLERLGPPADIVAAELSGPRSTGSTPVVEQPLPVTALAHKHEIDREDRVRQAQDTAAAPAVAARPRRRGVLLVIGAATAFAVGALAFGISTNNSDPAQQPPPPVSEAPAFTPSQSEESGSESPTWLPTDGQDVPTALPSDGPSEMLDDPTASAS
ncbi:HAAS signaling domain-containing protein [Streptomyces sp. 2A115]|uniref:HAAS signaling domain-containing protein n=1 Tax=Streptomyces sp. 2A115 TaxID=3457439 RepID=UPI003FCF7AE0